MQTLLLGSLAQRTHEMGLRMALGADGRNVVGLVVKNGNGLSRLLSGRLFEVGPGDLTIYVAPTWPPSIAGPLTRPHAKSRERSG